MKNRTLLSLIALMACLPIAACTQAELGTGSEAESVGEVTVTPSEIDAEFLDQNSVYEHELIEKATNGAVVTSQ